MSSHCKATPSTIASPGHFSKMRRRATFGFALVMSIVRLVPVLSPRRLGVCDFQDNAWLLELPIFLITLTYLSTPLLHESETVRTSRRVILGARKTAAFSQFGPVASVVAVAETVVPIATVPFLPLLRRLGGGTKRHLLYSAIQNRLSCGFIGYYLLTTIIWRSNTLALCRSSLYFIIPKLIIDRYLDYCRFTTERDGSYGQLQGERPGSPDGDSEDEVVAIGQDETIAEQHTVAQDCSCERQDSISLDGPVDDEEESPFYWLCGHNDDDEQQQEEEEEKRRPETSSSDDQVDEEKHPEPSSSSTRNCDDDDDDDDDQQDVEPNSLSGHIEENYLQQRPRSFNGQIKELEEVKDSEPRSSLLSVNGHINYVHNDEKQARPVPSSSSSHADPEERLAPTEYDDFLTLPIATANFPYLSCFLTTAQCAAIYILTTSSYIYAPIPHRFIEQLLQGDIVMTIWVVAGLATVACNLPGFGIGAPLFLARIIRQAQLGNDARLAAQAVLLLAEVVSTTVAWRWAPAGERMSLFDIVWKRQTLRIQNIRRILVFGSLVFIVFSIGLTMGSRILCEPRYLGSGFPSCKSI